MTEYDSAGDVDSGTEWVFIITNDDNGNIVSHWSWVETPQ